MIDFLFYFFLFILILSIQLFGAGLLIGFYRWSFNDEIVWMNSKRRAEGYVSALDILKHGFKGNK